MNHVRLITLKRNNTRVPNVSSTSNYLIIEKLVFELAFICEKKSDVIEGIYFQ